VGLSLPGLVAQRDGLVVIVILGAKLRQHRQRLAVPAESGQVLFQQLMRQLLFACASQVLDQHEDCRGRNTLLV